MFFFFHFATGRHHCELGSATVAMRGVLYAAVAYVLCTVALSDPIAPSKSFFGFSTPKIFNSKIFNKPSMSKRNPSVSMMHKNNAATIAPANKWQPYGGYEPKRDRSATPAPAVALPPAATAQMSSGMYREREICRERE